MTPTPARRHELGVRSSDWAPCASAQRPVQSVTGHAYRGDDDEYPGRESKCGLFNRDAKYVRKDHGPVSRRSSTSH